MINKELPFLASASMIHETLDVSSDRCPMTFVRTRLRLDRMPSGQVLEVRFAGQEPAENLPRSARDLGHEVLSLESGPEEGQGRILIRKA